MSIQQSYFLKSFTSTSTHKIRNTFAHKNLYKTEMFSSERNFLN